MADDIVTRLMDNDLLDFWGVEVFLLCRDAANEIELLRQLGDTMAHFVRAGDGTEMFAAVHAWLEARRG